MPEPCTALVLYTGPLRPIHEVYAFWMFHIEEFYNSPHFLWFFERDNGFIPIEYEEF